MKTVKFANPKYVGDPINAVKIFNEKEVDELIVLNIDVSVQNSEPDYGLIEKLAVECRMPLCYGGGVKTVEQVEKIISLGVEKVAISSAVFKNPHLIEQVADVVGSQSIVVVADVKRTERDGKYEIWTHNATRPTGRSPVEFAQQAESFGAGEVVMNSIDNDGVMKGYDFELIGNIRESVNLPITALGGAGELQDIEKLIKRFGIIGAAAGSLFVFKGKFRAVLISYPNRTQKDALIARANRAD